MIDNFKHNFSILIKKMGKVSKFCLTIFLDEIKEIIIHTKLLFKNEFQALTLKRIVLIISFVFIFLFFQQKIVLFINENLICHKNISNIYIDILLIILSFLFVIKFYKKIILNRYKSSFIEYYLLGVILFISIYYYKISINNNWTFLTTSILNIKIPYLLLFLLPIVSFFLFHFNRWFLLDLYKKEFFTNDNFIINDNPISHISNDELKYREIVNKLSTILIKDNHHKSISIGLIGPWGNGKSSVINLLENEFKKSFSYKEKDIISIHFLPYLNHKEDDIINEFFLNLSNNLSEFDGKISNQILDYSSKLTELYKDKNLKNFFDKSINSYNNSSAQELYKTIDEMLVSLNKKIIVFIDDLDRLNQNEILQVLKLIRNTANFRNTLFVVAMDKEYVLSRLKNSGDILNSSFIDKFFQLEVYLPQIETKILRDYFIKELNKPFENMPLDFDKRVLKTMNDKALLFSDYVKNFRDAKRVINQVRFDLLNYKEDHNYLNLKDFINFTFFKLKFPKVMKDLNDGKINFLEINTKTGIYSLIKNETEGNPPPRDIVESMYVKNFNDIEILKKYKIYDNLLNEKCIDYESINCEDRVLLFKTLAYLFGVENSPVNIDSIRKQENFRMLMQQRIFSDYYTNYEFKAFLDAEELNIKSYLLQIFENTKLSQLIDRLKDFVTNDENKIKKIIYGLNILFEKHKEYEVYHVDILLILDRYIDFLFKDKNNNDENIKWIKENIFEDKTLMAKTRSELLSNLWSSKHTNQLWNLSEDYCKTLAKNIFEEYLEQYQDILWNVNNYDVYGVYHDLKQICFDDINTVFKKFWKQNKIEVLCAQSTDSYMYSDNSFNITDTVNDIFGDRNKFVQFVENHNDKELPAIKEFLNLFKLLHIVGFKKYVIFEFKESKLMLEKIEYIKSIPTRPKNNADNLKREVFFETDYLELIDKIIDNVSYFDNVSLMGFKYNDKGYLNVVLDKSKGLKALSEFIAKLQFNSKILKFEDYKLELPEDIYSEEINYKIMDKYYFKSISIQPKFDIKNI